MSVNKMSSFNSENRIPESAKVSTGDTKFLQPLIDQYLEYVLEVNQWIAVDSADVQKALYQFVETGSVESELGKHILDAILLNDKDWCFDAVSTVSDILDSLREKEAESNLDD